jgi:hypothetical protein
LNYLQKEINKVPKKSKDPIDTTLLDLRISYICIRTFQEYILFIFSPIILTRLHIKWEWEFHFFFLKNENPTRLSHPVSLKGHFMPLFNLSPYQNLHHKLLIDNTFEIMKDSLNYIAIWMIWATCELWENTHYMRNI